LTTAAQRALLQSHAVTARASVSSPSLGQLPGLPITGGSMVIDTTSVVRRKATLTASSRWWPESPTDLLAPFGATATIDYGIVLGVDGAGRRLIEWVPLGVFVLNVTSETAPAGSGSGDGVTVELVDRAAVVAADRFDSPTQTVSGATVVAEITRLVRGSLGADLEVVDLTGSTQVAPVLEIERERWEDGVEKLADSIGAEVFFDVAGRVVIRPQPTLDAAPVWSVRTGRGGNLLSYERSYSRERVYNRVIAAGERSDGTAPAYAVASDTDPASPTRYGGPFGRKPRFLTSSALTTSDQCAVAAAALLERGRGLSYQVDHTILVNPALDGGDVVRVDDARLGAGRHILDQLTVPLGPAVAQQLGTRSTDLPGE
jgi:hypothetical protein